MKPLVSEDGVTWREPVGDEMNDPSLHRLTADEVYMRPGADSEEASDGLATD